MHPYVFTEVHGSSNEPSERISEGEIHSFHISSVDYATLIRAKEMHHLLRVTEHYPLHHLNYSVFLSFLTYLRILQITRRNKSRKWFSPSSFVGWLFYHPIHMEQGVIDWIPIV